MSRTSCLQWLSKYTRARSSSWIGCCAQHSGMSHSRRSIRSRGGMGGRVASWWLRSSHSRGIQSSLWFASWQISRRYQYLLEQRWTTRHYYRWKSSWIPIFLLQLASGCSDLLFLWLVIRLILRCTLRGHHYRQFPLHRQGTPEGNCCPYHSLASRLRHLSRLPCLSRGTVSSLLSGRM